MQSLFLENQKRQNFEKLTWLCIIRMRREGEVTSLGNQANETVDQWIRLQPSNFDIVLSLLFSDHLTFLETLYFHIAFLSEPNSLLLNKSLEAKEKLQLPTQKYIRCAFLDILFPSYPSQIQEYTCCLCLISVRQFTIALDNHFLQAQSHIWEIPTLCLWSTCEKIQIS